MITQHFMEKKLGNCQPFQEIKPTPTPPKKEGRLNLYQGLRAIHSTYFREVHTTFQYPVLSLPFRVIIPRSRNFFSCFSTPRFDNPICSAMFSADKDVHRTLHRTLCRTLHRTHLQYLAKGSPGALSTSCISRPA